jgi:hypothetical protein
MTRRRRYALLGLACLAACEAPPGETMMSSSRAALYVDEVGVERPERWPPHFRLTPAAPGDFSSSCAAGASPWISGDDLGRLLACLPEGDPERWEAAALTGWIRLKPTRDHWMAAAPTRGGSSFGGSLDPINCRWFGRIPAGSFALRRGAGGDYELALDLTLDLEERCSVASFIGVLGPKRVRLHGAVAFTPRPSSV